MSRAWDADLSALEREIAKDTKSLATLKESLETTNALSRKMIAMLDDFEARMATMEASVIPVYRNMQGLSHVYNNIESTVVLLKSVMATNDTFRQEETLLRRGPEVGQVKEYLESMLQIAQARTEMSSAGLKFCRRTYDRLEKLLDTAFALLLGRYREWLAPCSVPIDATRLLTGESGERPVNGIEPEVAMELYLIAAHAQADATVKSKLLGIYVEVRSQYLLQSTGALIRGIETSERRTVFAKHSHPFSTAVRAIVEMVAQEETMAHKVLVASEIAHALKMTIRPTIGLFGDTLETLGQRVRKAIAQREFADQIVVFDHVETFVDTFYTMKNEVFVEALKPSLQQMTSLAATFITDLIDDVKVQRWVGDSGV